MREYGPNGNRAKLTYPNGTETNYTYDDLNRLTNLSTTGPTGTIQNYSYTLGPAGNRERIDEHDGTARVYTYDDLYRLTNEEVSDNVSLVYSKAFSYDPVGNRLSQTTVGNGPPDSPTAPGAIGYTYDDRDRILIEGTQPYSWDENGNLVTKDAEASYFWDFENRLVRAEKVEGTVVAHAYDADGNRVRTEITPANGPPEVTEFLVDPSGSLSHVVAEADGAVALTAHYVRGDDLLAVIRPSEPRYFHADGLGSIRRLTDESGNITDGYTFTAFGELFAHTGPDQQPYAFAGEPLDFNVRFQYHRARWMDPRAGRFAGMDPFRGDPLAPATLQKYLYAGVNPVSNTDPTGQFFTIGSFSVATSIHNVLASTQSIVETAILDQIQGGGTSGLRSLLFGAAVIVGGALILRSAWKLIQNVVKQRQAARAAARSRLLELLRQRLRQVSGLGKGPPVLVDNSLGVNPQKVAEALRQRGINARSVNEVFAVDPGDPAIREVLEALNGRILSADKGAKIGEGFGTLRIRVPQRLRTVEGVVRLVEGQLP